MRSLLFLDLTISAKQGPYPFGGNQRGVGRFSTTIWAAGCLDSYIFW